MADTTNTVNLPELDFSEVSRADLYKRQVLAPTEKGEIYQGVVDKVSVSVTGDKSKNPGTLQFIFEIKPLDAQGKPVNQSLRQYVAIPKNNPSVPGHKVTQEQAKMAYRNCKDMIRALEGPDALPAGPRKVDGTDKFVDATGKEMTREAFDAWNKQSHAAIDAYIGKWYAKDENTGRRGCEDLKGALLFFTARKSDSGYTNVGYIRHDAGDATVVPATLVTQD